MTGPRRRFCRMACCLVLLLTAACQERPPLARDLQLWDEDCAALQAEPALVPRLQTLLASETQARRAQLDRKLSSPALSIDFLDLARELRPELRRQNPQPAAARPYAEEDIESFWIGKPLGRGGRSIKARLLRISDFSYTWVETGQGSQDTYLRELARRFDEEVYKPSQWVFGFEQTAGFDQDPRVHLLFASGMGQVLGYFNSRAGVPRAALPHSNEKEMLFLNLDYMGDREKDLGVLAHEMQHLIHWFHDPGEREFINEGLSEAAPALLFADVQPRLPRIIGAYARDPNLQLNSWAYGSQAGMRHYGSGAAFVHHLLETFGPEFAARLVREPKEGRAGIDSLLAQQGCAFTFDDLFADFAAALLAQDPARRGAAARLGFSALTTHWNGPLQDDAFGPHFRLAPAEPVAAELPPYAIHYVELTEGLGQGPLRLVFQGVEAVPYVVPDLEAPAMWSGRRNSGVARLQRELDLSTVASGADVRLETEMWWSIEENWDFGYVSVSRDGIDWQPLENELTSEEDPHGVALGPGLTGASPVVEGQDGLHAVAWDLSPYAGGSLHLRFDYVTDGALLEEGWRIGRVAVPAIGFTEDFRDGWEGWQNSGWLRVTEPLPVTWLVQIATLRDGRTGLLDLQRHAAAPDGSLEIELQQAGAGERIFVLVSPLAPIVTSRAAYEMQAFRPDSS